MITRNGPIGRCELFGLARPAFPDRALLGLERPHEATGGVFAMR